MSRTVQIFVDSNAAKVNADRKANTYAARNNLEPQAIALTSFKQGDDVYLALAVLYDDAVPAGDRDHTEKENTDD